MTRYAKCGHQLDGTEPVKCDTCNPTPPQEATVTDYDDARDDDAWDDDEYAPHVDFVLLMNRAVRCVINGFWSIDEEGDPADDTKRHMAVAIQAINAAVDAEMADPWWENQRREEMAATRFSAQDEDDMTQYGLWALGAITEDQATKWKGTLHLMAASQTFGLSRVANDA